MSNSENDSKIDVIAETSSSNKEEKLNVQVRRSQRKGNAPISDVCHHFQRLTNNNSLFLLTQFVVC